MGIIQIDLFTTLDLVAQAPGEPDEDTSNGFAFGGWQVPLIGEISGAGVDAAYVNPDALLLGRKTYDVFAGFWPKQDNPFADLFNSVPKYVASRGTADLSWAGSSQIGSDLVSEVRALRDRHEHVKVIGSLDLVRTLLREQLFDRLELLVHPIVLGTGKKLFDGGEVPTNLTLLAPPTSGPQGAVLLRYGRVDGVPATGNMADLRGDA